MIKKISLLLLTALVAIGVSAQLRLPGGVPDAKLWLRSDTLLSTSGTDITGWGDITGNNIISVNGTAPKLQANAFGTISAPRLAGASSFYTDKAYDWKSIYVVANYLGRNSLKTPIRSSSLMGWYDPSAPNAYARYIFYINTSANVQFNFGMFGQYPYFRWMGLQSPKYTSRGLMNSLNYIPSVHGFFLNEDATDLYATVNGASVYWTQDHPTGHCFGKVFGQLIIGSGSPAGAASASTTANAFYGDIAEVIAFDRVLTPEESKKIETYISARYGVTQSGNIPFKSSSAEFDQANTVGRDYVLSDGTVIWPGQTDPSLNEYRAYFNFLINDNASGLHQTLSKPIVTADQWRTNGSTVISYKDNNVSVAHGATFSSPTAFTEDKAYFVMGAKTAFPIDTMTNFANSTSLVKKQAVLDSLVYGTPYTVSKVDIGGKSYMVWDREYSVKCGGVSNISLQAASLGTTTWKAWTTKFGTTPGVLTIKDGTATFTSGSAASGVLTVNNIPVQTDSKLFLVFASTSETTQINEGPQTLCTGSDPYAFTAAPAGGTWSANAPSGVFTPATVGKYYVTYTVNGVIDTAVVDVVGATPSGTLTLDRTTIYNGQTVNVSVSNIANAGQSAVYELAIDAGSFSGSTGTPAFVVDGSALSSGTHAISVKITAANACSSPAIVSANIEKADGTSPIMPAGVEGAALWVRADRILSLDESGRALTLENLAGTALSVTANTTGTYTPAEINTNWMNGQAALFFNENSFYHTNAPANWLSTFIVHDYLGGTGQSAVSTLHPTLGATTTDCYYYNLSGSCTYGFNNGYLANEQKINLYGSSWQATNFDKTDGLLKARGALLPMLGSIVSRTDRILSSVNGTPGYDNYPVYIKNIDLNGYLNLGAAVKSGSTMAAPTYSKQIYGHIAEFIGFSRILTAVEINKIESYLAMRYGFNIRGYHADRGGRSATLYRDYSLSNGTLVFPAYTDQSIRSYYSYINFLVRDDVTALHVKRSAPIAHGLQGSFTDIRPTGGGNSQPLAPQVHEAGVVLPASTVQVAVGSDFNAPADIASDKAYFAMGRNCVAPDQVGSISTPEREYTKVWLKDYLVRCSGIDKVSFRIDISTELSAQIGIGAGVLVDAGGTKTFTPGTFENNQVTINNVSVSNNAQVYFIMDSHTNATELSLGDIELCEGAAPVTFVPTTSGGTWSSNAPGGVFSAVDAGTGLHQVSYTVGEITTTSLVKVSPKLVPYFVLGVQSNAMLTTESNSASIVAPENGGTNPSYAFAIDSKTYVPSASGTFSIDASALAFGTHYVYAKMESNAKCTLNEGIYTDSIAFEVINPASLPKPAGVNDVVLWLRADKGVSLNTDGTLKNWRDYSMQQSVSVFDAYKSTASTLNPSFMSGYPAILMKGSTILRVRDNAVYRTVFVVNNYSEVTNKLMGFHNATTNSMAADASIFEFTSSPNLNYKLGITGGTGNTCPYFRYGNAYTNTDANIIPGLTLPMINGFYMKTDVSDLYATMNGTVAHFTQAHPAGHAWQAFDGRLILGGAYLTSANYAQASFEGNLAEVIAFNRELSASETNRVESYLAMKYGYTFRGNAQFQAQGTAGVNSTAFITQPNSPTRDYVLSNGTVVWPGASDAGLSDYLAYFNFMVRDDGSGLNKAFSRPQQAVDQLLGTYYRSVIYLDNNVSICNGDDFAKPAALANDGDYLIMGATAWYQAAPTDGSKILVTGTNPAPSYLQDPVTKKIIRVWSRKHHIRSNGVSTVSIKFDTLKTLTPYVNAADKLGLILEKDGIRTFVPGVADVLGAVLFEGVSVLNGTDVYLALGEENFTIDNADLAKATVRDRYHQTLSATCSGASSFSFAVVSGSLPSGLMLNTDGTFEGSPTVSGSYPITVRATDNRGFTAEKEFTLEVAADVNCAPIALPRSIVRAGSVGESSRVSLNVPELGSYRVSALSAGTLPTGLSLTQTGELEGIPTEQGTRRVTVLVKDLNGCESNVVLDVNVDLPKTLSASVVSLYPNPASDYVNVQINADIASPIRVQIRNTSNVKARELVLEAGTRQVKLSLEGLIPGQYYIVLTADGKKVALPILVK